MKFIKKVLKWILCLILLLVLILVGVYFAAGALIKTAVSTVVPPITQTTASLADVDISLFSGKVSLQGLQIGNPAGFSDKNVFELKEITVLFDPKSILTDKVFIQSVKIDGVTVNAELNMKMDTNLSVIKQNVQNFVGTDSKPSANAQASADTTEAKSDKKVVIRKLVASNVSLNPGVAGVSAAIPVPTIQLNNIGEKENRSVADVIAMVLNKITLESITAFAQAGTDVIKEKTKSVTDTLKGFLN